MLLGSVWRLIVEYTLRPHVTLQISILPASFLTLDPDSSLDAFAPCFYIAGDNDAFYLLISLL